MFNGITSETPKAIASTGLIYVSIPNLSAVFFTCTGLINYCTTLTEIKFKDLLIPSRKLVNNPVEPS